MLDINYFLARAYTDSQVASIAPKKKTTMDAVASVNTIYGLGTQSSVSITLPTGTLGDEIKVIFYSTSPASTLSVTGTYVGSLPIISTNQRVELGFLHDGTKWSVLSALQSNV